MLIFSISKDIKLMKQPVYLDYSATTPVDPRVLEAMLPWFCERFGNPANISHSYGRDALQAVHQARQALAHLLGAQPSEITFTSGATESNNLAFKGLSGLLPEKNQIITVATEHKAVLYSARAMEKAGFELEILPVNKQGQIDLDLLAAKISAKTALVSVMMVNNEIGNIHPIAEIGALCRDQNVLFHCDAVQAGGKLPIDVEAQQIDMLSLSAHKMYGPKGIGCLYIRRKEPQIPLQACIEGGGQESGLRAGTLNIPGIVGFAKAAELALAELKTEAAQLKSLRERLWAGIQAEIPEVYLTTPLQNSSPAILHVCFPGLSKGRLIATLKDLAVSAGSACSSASGKASYVLEALGLESELSNNALRFSMGRFSTEAEIDSAVKSVSAAVQTLKANPSKLPF
jgi:cysteine desulfurase